MGGAEMAIGVKDKDEDQKAYFAEAESWDRDMFVAAVRSRRVAWIVAIVAIVFAAICAAAVLALSPLKTVVPYAVTLERSTGATEVTQELRGDKPINYDEAIRKYFLADYVRARAGWIPQAREAFFRPVLELSTRAEQTSWTAHSNTTTPDPPQTQITHTHT